MAQFAKTTFSAPNYAAFRPVYPSRLYTIINNYHKGNRKLVVDLGCGPGIATREISKSFDRAIGTDPSAGMIKSAVSETSSQEFPNIEYRQSAAEDLKFIKNGEVDMVVAAQAAHWFNLDTVWHEMARVLRPGGTLAFWGYKDPVFVDYPKATKILDEFTYGPQHLGDYWEQPGRFRVQNKLRDLIPPETEGWHDVQRVEYEPAVQGRRSGEGEVLMEKRLNLAMMQQYVTTWSSLSKWKDAHPDHISLAEGGDKGDLNDDLFKDLVEAEPDFKNAKDGWQSFEVDIEWGSGILLARAKE